MIPWLAYVTIALALPPDCPSPVITEPERSWPIADGASFFQRTAPGTRETTFASGGMSPSRIMNLDTGVTKPLDGNLDSVLSPDGQILAIPQDTYFDGATGRRRLFRRNDPPPDPSFVYSVESEKLMDRKNNRLSTLTLEQAKQRPGLISTGHGFVYYTRDQSGDFKPNYVDHTEASYFSMATLRRTDQATYYRNFLSTDELRVRDVRLNHQTGQIEPVGTSRPACKRNIAVSLPIIAPNGREFSYYDYQTQTTRIMSLGDDGDCKQIDSLPALIGKPSFSPDGKKIAFHLDRAATIISDREFASPAATSRLGVYVYDRETKRITPIDDAPETSKYYPSFLSNDELTYFKSNPDVLNRQTTMEVVRMRPGPSGSCRGCDASDELRFASVVLGQMYGAHCGLHELRMENAVFGLSGVTPANCRNFVNNLSAEDLGEEPTVARIKPRVVDTSQPTHRFAGIIRSVREYLRGNPDRPPPRMQLAFESREAPKRLTRDHLLAICDRLEVVSSDASGTSSAH